MRKPRADTPEPPVGGMSDQELDRWVYAQRSRGPLATNPLMLDGFVTAMAAGPLRLDLLRAISAVLALVGGSLQQQRRAASGRRRHPAALQAQAQR